MSLQGLEGRGDRVPAAWGGVRGDASSELLGCDASWALTIRCHIGVPGRTAVFNTLSVFFFSNPWFTNFIKERLTLLQVYVFKMMSSQVKV